MPVRHSAAPLFTGLLLAGILLTEPLSAAAADPQKLSAQELTFFEKKIRPVLVSHCYACHSEMAAQSKKLRGGLRLDTRDGMLRGGDSGMVLDLDSPTDSLLMESLRYESLEMPPAGRLPAQVIADFQKWIALGAPDPRNEQTQPSKAPDIMAGRNHWSFQPLKKTVIPQTGPVRADSPIDAFILAGLDSAKLTQVPPATRSVLVRRLYFDLLGLPPTPDQIERFVQDDSPDAYVRLVDELLASPHFGERWGRHWLDVVRFAESITLRGFIFHEAWRYRDYVIETFNGDIPFDIFIREQIAGDLLSATSLEQQRRHAVATTFLTLGNNNLEDQDKGKLRMDVVDEQLETIGRGFLAQTIGCARCHDHKFDPIPTRDYYALAGILRNTRTLNHANVSKWIELPLPLSPEREAVFQHHETAVATLQARIKTLKTSGSRAASAQTPMSVDQVAGVVVDDQQAEKTGNWTLSQFAKNYVGTGYQHDSGQPKGKNTAIFRPDLPHDGQYEVRFAYNSGSGRSPAVPVTVISADGPKTVTINQRKRPTIDGRFVSLGRFSFLQNGQNQVVVTNRGTTGILIIDAVQFLPVKQKNKDTAASGTDATDDQQKQQKQQKQQMLAQLERELKVLTESGMARPKYMSVREEDNIEDTRIHIRGNVHNLGAAAPRGFLQVIPAGRNATFSKTHSGRRELADWIGASDNPLASRVLANRLWHWLFGAGLVLTPDNFGTTGQQPSHPELLDYLATRLLESNWSIKSLLREIVLSNTYQLSSVADARNVAADPDNRMLWRMNRRRLDAESLLDSMSSINGRLNLEMGGSTIRPGTSNDYGYQHDSNRRAVYWPVFRNSLPSLFEVFDFANPSMVTGRRESSNTAPQALFLMNNPWVIEQADHAAAQLLAASHLNDRQRAQRAILQTLGRQPLPGELRNIAAYVQTAGNETGELQTRWSQVIQSLFASIDFRYLH